VAIKKKGLPSVLLGPTIAHMNTTPELREQLRESREENRGFWARLESIADIITCQDDEEEEDEDEDRAEGDDKEEEEERGEGEVDKYYLG